MPNRTLLHVIIPGPPHTQERHRWGRGRIYDPSSKDKQTFQWQLAAAVPHLKPEMTARIGVLLTIWSAKVSKAGSVVKDEDADNFLKFYMDAMSPPKIKRKHRDKIDQSQCFAVWGNDCQVDEARVRVYRGCSEPQVEILVYAIGAA
jgi:Holliday junction resolvase RusA-like endonuclease